MEQEEKENYYAARDNWKMKHSDQSRRIRDSEDSYRRLVKTKFSDI